MLYGGLFELEIVQIFKNIKNYCLNLKFFQVQQIAALKNEKKTQ